MMKIFTCACGKPWLILCCKCCIAKDNRSHTYVSVWYCAFLNKRRKLCWSHLLKVYLCGMYDQEIEITLQGK